VRLSIQGKYQDTIRDVNAVELLRSPPRSNVVVFRAMDLIAQLLRNEPGLNGISYWAVGSGGQQQPEAAMRRTRRLANEIYRKPLDPKKDIEFDPKTRTLTIQTTFGAGEAVGNLNEFGLFGGDASARQNSGYLINYATHDVIEKSQGTVLRRRLELTFRSDDMLDSALDLIAGLLRSEPSLCGIRYWALGAGDPEWDQTPPEMNPKVNALANEVYRKSLIPNRHTSYDPNTKMLKVRASFAFDEAADVLREFGVFGGNATNRSGSGHLVYYESHSPINKHMPLGLENEISLSLASEATLEVPGLMGLTLHEARSALENAGLGVGTIKKVESATNVGLVIGQYPAAGEPAPEGGFVDVTLAVAIRVAVPNLRGVKPETAATCLADLGLVLSDETPTSEESKAPSGTIIRQKPLAGVRVGPGTIVQVTLATPITTTVPTILGLTRGEAAVVLDKASLNLAPLPHAVKGSDGPYGIVLEQNPGSGERVPLETEVRLTLSAPWTVTVPDLSGRTPEEAAGQLRDAAAKRLEELGRPLIPPGLVLGAQESVESEREQEIGTIVGQTPQAGKDAPLYGTVDVAVAIPKRVKVPELIGLKRDEAEESLENVGLKLGKIATRPDVSQAGTVIEQDPRPGSIVPKGSSAAVVLADPILVEVPKVTEHHLKYAREVIESRDLILADLPVPVEDEEHVWVTHQTPAAGAKVPLRSQVVLQFACDVPLVLGESLTDAQSILLRVGLTLGERDEQVSDKPVGTVLEQVPMPPARAPLGSAVDIVVAKRQERVPVPDVVGISQANAKEKLEAAGLQLTVGGQHFSDQPEGTVLAQDPAAGALVTVGSSVAVDVSRGVETVIVPSIVGMLRGDAEARLEQVGLTLEVGDERPDDQPAGTILVQDPQAGERISIDNIVKVVLSTGPQRVTAGDPSPADGALHEATWVNLSWSAGNLAVSHDVYLGDNFEDVNAGTGDTFRGNQTTTLYVAGFPAYAYPEGLVPGTTYYWRIDEVDDANPNSPWKGNVWSFTVPSKAGHNPNPPDGAEIAETEVTLSWTAGFGARSHTVYFGDNLDHVSNATGAPSQRTTTFNPGTLERGKTYYWRIDEFDGAATHKGTVWSFTTRDFLVIDDFEAYDSDANQIWYAWRDGSGYGTPASPPYSPGNGTGSAVGDDTTASFTEESIVHSGRQSMPFTYDNSKQDSSKYSEVELRLSALRDWTREGVEQLSLWFRGHRASVGSFKEGLRGSYSMTGSGADIWNDADEFHYAFKMLTGPGVITARVESISDTDPWAKAGVMIRETLEPGSKFAALYITPGNGCRFQARTDTGVNAVSDTPVATDEQKAIGAPCWVRLERDGEGNFAGYYSRDGVTWQALPWNPQRISMNSNVYIGLALTSHNADATCQARFSNVSIANVAYLRWRNQDIGIVSNDPEPMYIAVADGQGASAVVYHDDPRAVTTDTWTQWAIPLQAFAELGVNLTDVDRIAIGIGTRGNTTTPGGSGKMFFDDVRLYPSPG
jgi:beta-lactam-binding protein with PASTA domain/uncharacterized protein YozE (UPF0346 family)